MRGIRGLSLVMLALLFGVSAAGADVGKDQSTTPSGTKMAGVYQVGNVWYGMPLVLTSGGSLQMTDTDRDRNWVLLAPNIVNGAVVPGNAMVSSPINTYGATKLALQFYVSTANMIDSAGVYYFALQVRHGATAAADSNSSFVRRRVQLPTGAALVDSIGQLSGLSSTTISNVTNADNTGLPTTAMPGEYVIPILISGGASRWQWIPLPSGPDDFGPYTVIRIRPLSCALGTALSATATTVLVTYRADLVGQR